jgi:membrane protein YdbS with pleckstrin-like domain
MAAQITLKRSPIVLFRTFALIEISAFVIYVLAVGHGNAKYDFYTHLLWLSQIISYQMAKYLLLSGAQFAITIYAFFHWYYETFRLRANTITHRWGVFFKKEKIMPLEKAVTMTLVMGPFGKWLHYGSIRVESEGATMMLADVSYPALHVRTIERMIKGQSNDGARDLMALLDADEHEQLEFKSSLRVDQKQGGVNREVEKAAMKTIAAFMNSKGGTLLLGVADGRTEQGRIIVGLAGDYASLPRKDSDGFENHFTQLFNRALGPENRNLVQLQFHTIGDQEICLVRVAQSMRPVYLTMDDNEYFYVRTGNGTTPLKMSEVETYTSARWPRRAMIS